MTPLARDVLCSPIFRESGDLRMLADLKFALRGLRNSPGFTVVAVLTLALGIGATVAIFSLVNAALLRPLPYAEPERLARVYVDAPSSADARRRRFRAATTEYFQLERGLQSWQSLDAWQTGGVNFAPPGAEPTRVTIARVTGGLLATLGVGPALGRVVTPQDDAVGAPLTAVLSHRLWQSAFGGSPAAIGRDVVINGRTYTVVGVMPESFAFPPGEADASDAWVPLQIDPALPVNDHSVSLLGRLKPGVALSTARAELETFVAQRGEAGTAHRWDPDGHTLVAYNLHDEVVLGVRPALRTLFGAVFFLLLIACVNVANLLLSRAEARQREIATRSALGAALPRLAAQFAIEGTLLSVLGTAAGVLVAYGALRLVAAAGAVGIPQLLEAGVDGPVLLFAAGTSLVTGLLFGLAPLQHVRRNLQGTIRGAAAATTRGIGAQRFRQALTVGQLALALILLTGTGLMLRTFWNLQRVDGGFDSSRVITAAVALREETYAGEGARSFWTRLQEALDAIPGVENATLASALPPVTEGFGWGTPIPGFVAREGGSVPVGPGGFPVIDYYQVVGSSYFDTLKIGLVAGRFFDARDDASGPKAAIINETMAHAIWGDESPLGRQLVATIDPVLYTIVGVVADAKNNGVDKPTGTAIYLSYGQVPAGTGLLRAPFVAVRSANAPASVIAAVRRAVHDADPNLPLAQIRTLDDVVSASQSRPRFLTLVLTLFAGVSLALAAVGIYGVISYSVAQRTKEFGIRMALGAQPGAVLNLELGRGLALTGAGVLLGVGGSYALMRFLSAFLFGVPANDLLTFAGVAALLALVATGASYIAARRATQIDPLAALRTE